MAEKDQNEHRNAPVLKLGVGVVDKSPFIPFLCILFSFI